MSILKSPAFIICCIFFLLHQLQQKLLKFSIPVVDRYADVLLAMPIILTLLIAERRMLFKRGKNYRLSALEVVIATLFVAFVSEVLFPALSDSFSGDWLDVLCFAVGALIFFFAINPKPQPQKEMQKRVKEY